MKRILSVYCMVLLLISMISIFGSYQISRIKEASLKTIQQKLEYSTKILDNRDYSELRQQFDEQITMSKIFHIIYGILIVGLLIILVVYKRIDKAKEIQRFARLGKQISELSLMDKMKTTINETKNKNDKYTIQEIDQKR